jgi:peptide alpha-N-acetyltransferase
MNEEKKCIGTIISKIDPHKDYKRGYIGMLAVDKPYRQLGIGK